MNIRKVKHIFSILIVALVSSILIACDQSMVYSESIAIKSEGWAKEHTLEFTPQIEENAKTYNIYIWVRHTKGYKYSNIWLKLESDPSLVNDSTGLLEIPLADKTGMWLGDCSQSLCTAKFLLKEDYRFENAEAFKLVVSQYMREDILNEVKNVGLEFELAE